MPGTVQRSVCSPVQVPLSVFNAIQARGDDDTILGDSHVSTRVRFSLQNEMFGLKRMYDFSLHRFR